MKKKWNAVPLVHYGFKEGLPDAWDSGSDMHLFLEGRVSANCILPCEKLHSRLTACIQAGESLFSDPLILGHEAAGIVVKGKSAP